MKEYSKLELAKLVNTSKSTITRILDSKEINPVRTSGQKLLFDETAKKAILEYFGVVSAPYEPVEAAKDNKENLDKSTYEIIISNNKELISTLKEQIKSLESDKTDLKKQIEIKDIQIQNWTNTFQANQTLDALKTKNKTIDSPQEQNIQKDSLWQRIIKKRRK
ncbi:hypothetical protein QMA56_10595 [Leuconostoc falkenbergense]|uniref:hypothetical protein n=1 Tax=Leuconostoc falkenbergense TaxID=2766470 RepID=UPI0024ADA078|nr:hypothetical protein [Leuconostoc falkenbergense]MDI6668149.1 hypothetical protein [Leuconostoc falkenbergense]